MPEPTNQPDPTDTTQVTTPAPEDSQPPVADTPKPGVDPQILQAYNEQLLAEARERNRLQRELDEERRKNNQPKPVTPEEEKKFFDTPVSTTRDLIREEIRQAVAPLNQFTAQQQRFALIEQFKQQMKNSAAFPYINQIESIFDQVIGTVAQLDANSVTAAYNLALGTYLSQGGQLQAPKPANAPAPNRGNQPVPTIPPHVRPTPTAPTPSNAPKQLRALSEAEKKIARFNNMSDAEYLMWTEGVNNAEVAHLTDEQIKERMK